MKLTNIMRQIRDKVLEKYPKAGSIVAAYLNNHNHEPILNDFTVIDEKGMHTRLDIGDELEHLLNQIRKEQGYVISIDFELLEPVELASVILQLHEAIVEYAEDGGYELNGGTIQRMIQHMVETHRLEDYSQNDLDEFLDGDVYRRMLIQANGEE